MQSLIKELNHLLSRKSKKQILNIQFYYILNSLAEFLNISFFYTFLLTLFNQRERSDSLIFSFLNNNLGINFDIYYIAIFLIILFFLSNLLTVFSNYKIFFISEKISVEIGTNYYQELMNSNFNVFQKIHPSEVIKKLNLEIPSISTSIIQPILISLSKFLIFLVFLIFIIINFSFVIIIYLGCLLIFYLALFIIFKKLLFNFGKDVSLLYGKINRIFYETVNNFQILKLLKKEFYFKEDVQSSLYDQAKKKSFGYLISQFPKSFLEFFVFSIFTVFLIKNYNDENNNFVEIIPVVGVFAFIGYRCLPIGQQIYSSLTTVQSSKFLLEKIQKDFKNFRQKIKPINDVKKIKINNLKLENIHFRYNKKKEYLIKNFNFNFKKNNIYLIQGVSGRGKTTLINLIMGFLKPDKGKIIINNKIDLNDKNIGKFQSNVMLSPQFSYLFNDTLKRNITLNFSDDKNIDTKKFNEICTKFNFKNELREFFYNPSKKIGPKGQNLSGGQIQRISLARTLYNDRNLIIFDEPTNNLDNKNKKIIIELIKKIKTNKIIIILSHDVDIEKYNFKKINF